MTFNEKVWTGIGLLFLVVLLAYIFNNNLFGVTKLADDISGELKEKQEGIIEKQNTASCPEEIIPDKMILFEAEGTAGKSESLSYHYDIENDWKDGTPLIYWVSESNKNNPFSVYDDLAGQDCPEGSEEGQNKNYFYCRPLIYKKEKTEMGEDGTIGKTINTEYKVTLVLKPIEDEEWAVRSAIDVNHVNIYGNYSIVSSTCVKK